MKLEKIDTTLSHSKIVLGSCFLVMQKITSVNLIILLGAEWLSKRWRRIRCLTLQKQLSMVEQTVTQTIDMG